MASNHFKRATPVRRRESAAQRSRKTASQIREAAEPSPFVAVVITDIKGKRCLFVSHLQQESLRLRANLSEWLQQQGSSPSVCIAICDVDLESSGNVISRVGDALLLPGPASREGVRWSDRFTDIPIDVDGFFDLCNPFSASGGTTERQYQRVSRNQLKEQFGKELKAFRDLATSGKGSTKKRGRPHKSAEAPQIEVQPELQSLPAWMQKHVNAVVRMFSFYNTDRLGSPEKRLSFVDTLNQHLHAPDLALRDEKTGRVTRKLTTKTASHSIQLQPTSGGSESLSGKRLILERYRHPSSS